MNITIQIMQDTPFHSSGKIVSLAEFRNMYGSICTRNTSDENLIKYLKTQRLLYVQYGSRINGKDVGQWFSVIEEYETEPLSFIYADMFYVKQFDGQYHGYLSPTHYAQDNKASVSVLQIATVVELIKNAKFKQEILYITDNVNKKL